MILDDEFDCNGVDCETCPLADECFDEGDFDEFDDFDDDFFSDWE